MGLPNFFIIGAGRSGTTSLHHYLQQHPEIYMSPVKSPSYFFCYNLPPIEDPNIRLVTNEYFVKDIEKYRGLFDGVTNEKAIGEVSPVYLSSTKVANKIFSEIPNAKIIAILRNPVDRVYARFIGRSRDGFEKEKTFTDLVAKEKQQPLVRDVAFSTYLAGGFCYHFLKTYFDVFDHKNIRVYIFEDLVKNPKSLLVDIFKFLDVDANIFIDTGKKYNKSEGEIKNNTLKTLWMKSSLLRARLRPYIPRSIRDSVFPLISKQSHKPIIDPTLRKELVALYKDDILQLQSLLQRDLSHWLI